MSLFFKKTKEGEANSTNPSRGTNESGQGVSTETVKRFWRLLEESGVGGAMSLVSPDAKVVIHPANIDGGRAEFESFLRETISAFPDIKINVDTSFEGSENDVVLELQMEGTQAGDWLGIANQEKFFDSRQVWRMGVGGDNEIVWIHAFWDQNQVYRRLAVKRLDKVSII